MKKTILILMFVIAAAAFVKAQTKAATAPDFKGIQYAFNRASAPEYDKKSLYVIFYGYGKSGWNAARKENYPYEARRVFSKIYRLDNMPNGYDWNSPSKAPYQMMELFHNYLIKEYKFTTDLHGVSYIKSSVLSKFEQDLAEHLETMNKLAPSDKVVADTKFTFSYKDPNSSDPYSFEYKGQ